MNSGSWISTSQNAWPTCSANVTAICPDLLRYEQIGEADGLRGRVVRLFFLLMRFWPPPSGSESYHGR